MFHVEEICSQYGAFGAKSIAASKEIKYQEKMKAKTEAKIAAEARGSSVTKKKSGTGKKVGIVLIALQIFVMAFSIYQGNPIWVKAQYQPGASAAGMYLGYFLPAIIGVILIIRGNKKAEVAETVTSSAAEESISPSTGSADATYGFTTRAHICPKCGGNVEDEDNYCIHCGAPIVRI